MARITDLYLFAETSTIDGAGSGSTRMEFEIKGVKFRLRDLPGDNFQPKRCDLWRFSVAAGDHIDDTEVAPGDMRISNGDPDGWLPASIWVVSRNEAGEFKVLAGIPDWPVKWFDPDSVGNVGESSSSWALDQG